MCKCLYVVEPTNLATSRLYTLDPATASAHLVGPIGIASVADIAFHGPTLYGVTSNQFLRIDPGTGTGSVIGATGFNDINSLEVASDGTIYAGTAGGQLIWINPVTGAGTLIGSFGPGLVSNGDLAVDSNGVLYGALGPKPGRGVKLARIDRSTGVATVIGSPAGVSTLSGLAFFCCHLYGCDDKGRLFDINVASAKATVIGKNSLTMWGMSARMCCGC